MSATVVATKSTTRGKPNARNSNTTKEKDNSVKFHPDLHTKVSLAKDSALGGYGLITFLTQANIPISEFVISHPIGVTDLPDSTYVVNRLKDIRDLKSRITDPNEDRIQKKRDEFRLEVLKKASILEGSAVLGYTFTKETPFPGIPWGDAYKSAKEKRSAALKEHNENAAKIKLRRGQKKPVFSRRLDEFYDDNEFKLKTQIDLALSKSNFLETSKKEFPTTWRTLLDDDVPQRELQLPKTVVSDFTITQVMDKTQAEIWKFLVGKSDLAKSDKEKDQEIDFWKKKLTLLQKEMEEAKAKHSLEIKNLENRDQVILTKNREISELTSQIENLKKDFHDLEDDYSNLREELDTLQQGEDHTGGDDAPARE